MNLRLRVGFMLVIALSLALPANAGAETISQLKAQLEAAKSKSAKAGAQFTAAYWKLDETEVRLSKSSLRLNTTAKELSVARKHLNGRVGGMYRLGGVGMLEVVFGSQSFDQFASRLFFLRRVSQSDAQVVAEVRRLRVRLKRERTVLLAQRTARAADVARLRKQRGVLEAKLRSAESEFAAVKARLDAARSTGPREAGVLSVPGANGMVFPVVGSYYYANTWGASRSGGRRRHQGTDIMAPAGTPCVAVTSGTVSAKEGGLGGRTIWLTGDSGWSFYYAHLQSWAVTSGHVKAGQVIGYVGSTGNAAGGAPHLHFQMHPGGGSPVNPYPYLRAME